MGTHITTEGHISSSITSDPERSALSSMGSMMLTLLLSFTFKRKRLNSSDLQATLKLAYYGDNHVVLQYK